jgi:hypothetical protein
MSVPHDGSPEHLRKMLLGKSGPYADPRDAIDELDNVHFWLSTCSRELYPNILNSLLTLANDSDITVASGAVLALDFIPAEFATGRVLLDLLDKPQGLDRKPSGFRRSSLGTIGSQLLRVVARTNSAVAPMDWLKVLELPFIRPDAAAILAHLAIFQPHFVLHVARKYLTHSNTDVLINLPKHWMKIALATQFTPWPSASIEVLGKAARWLKWDTSDWAALERVLRDDYPCLTHPPGTPRNKRWWIIDGDGAEWSLWESVDQEYCIEVLQPGYAYEFRPFPFDQALLEPLQNQGHTAIASQLKQWKSGKR